MKTFFLGLFYLLFIATAFAQDQPVVNGTNVAGFGYLNNQTFAELQLEDTAGQIFNTSSLLGKNVYVDFWFTSCAPCVKEIPYSKCLQQFFAADTNIAFLGICIESVDKKAAWKQMVREKQMGGVQLFYARNRPQQINLLREYDITFPTYLLLNKQMKLIGYDVPRPSEGKLVYWILSAAEQGKTASESYKKIASGDRDYKEFMDQNTAYILNCEKK